MKIAFYARISGLARVKYSKQERECQSYKVFEPGEWYDSLGGSLRQCPCYALHIDGGGVYELKPGSKVKVVK